MGADVTVRVNARPALKPPLSSGGIGAIKSGPTAHPHTRAADAPAIARRIIRGDFVSGFQTPAKVYGADLALRFKGTTRNELRPSFSALERIIS